MENRFKFRAWDGNKFSDAAIVDGIDWNLLGDHPTGNELMQWTGIKDKNGVDIYEGDIIKDLVSEFIYEIRFGFVSRHQYTGWYCYFSSRTTSLNADYDTCQNSQIIVIGNIFETPELLPKPQ